MFKKKDYVERLKYCYAPNNLKNIMNGVCCSHGNLKLDKELSERRIEKVIKFYVDKQDLSSEKVKESYPTCTIYMKYTSYEYLCV